MSLPLVCHQSSVMRTPNMFYYEWQSALNTYGSVLKCKFYHKRCQENEHNCEIPSNHELLTVRGVGLIITFYWTVNTVLIWIFEWIWIWAFCILYKTNLDQIVGMSNECLNLSYAMYADNQTSILHFVHFELFVIHFCKL